MITYPGKNRELTRPERAAIRKLVISMCANYDWEYACLQMDGPCYMMGKHWTGGYCTYFRQAVLPLDPVLQASLLQRPDFEVRPCGFCGTPLLICGRRAYCSAACAKKAQRRQQREHMRKKRGRR